MMEIITLDQASTGWKDKYTYSINNEVPGYLRGFNIEYKMPDGRLDYSSCIFIYGELSETHPSVEHNFELVKFVSGGEPTGRAVFRGYYTEGYDTYERDEYVEPVSPDEINRANSDNEGSDYVWEVM